MAARPPRRRRLGAALRFATASRCRPTTSASSTTDRATTDRLRRDVGAAFSALFGEGGSIAGLCRLDDGVAYVVDA